MEIEDLMAGDYVYNDEKQICKVCSIIAIGIPYAEADNLAIDDGCFTLLYDYSGIPLTPEILEKNGFGKGLDEDNTECYRYYSSAADGYIKITLYDGGDGDWSIEIINYEKFDDNEIVYKNDFIFLKVHQLQHALRLCGIKKEIKL